MTNETETKNADYARTLSKRFHNAGLIFFAAQQFYQYNHSERNGGKYPSREEINPWLDQAMPVLGEAISLVESLPQNKWKEWGVHPSITKTFQDSDGTKVYTLFPDLDKSFYFGWLEKRITGFTETYRDVDELTRYYPFENLKRVCFGARDIVNKLRTQTVITPTI